MIFCFKVQWYVKFSELVLPHVLFCPLLFMKDCFVINQLFLRRNFSVFKINEWLFFKSTFLILHHDGKQASFVHLIYVLMLLTHTIFNDALRRKYLLKYLKHSLLCLMIMSNKLLEPALFSFPHTKHSGRSFPAST